MSIKKDILWRIYLAFFAVCCLGFTIVYKTVRIQYVEGPELRAKSDSATIAFKPIDAERGNILSEDGRLLATSLPFFEVRMDVSAQGLTDEVFNEKVDSLAHALANYYKDKPAQLYKQELVYARKQNLHNFLIAKKASYPEMEAIKTFPILNRGRYKGGLLTWQFSKRVIPFQSLAKRTIGYVRDSIQPVGLEGTFDNELSGIKGKRLMQRIAGGTWIPVNDEDEISSENGKDVVTTIDVNLQDVLENALRNALVKNNADHGTAVLMEVATGKIKAIVNLGKVGDGQYDEILNYAVGEADEPGSTFKLASAISLLEDGYVKLDDSIDIEYGKHAFYKDTMRDAEQHKVNNVTIKHAFEISSNVAFSKLVDKYYHDHPERFTQHLLNLGLTNRTGVEIPGEAEPVIHQPSQKGWSGTTLPWMAVGYSVQETPLQMLTLYNAIANNGYVVKPYLVKEIQVQGKTVKKFEPQVSNKRLCSQATLQKVHEMMEGVVENGTASNIKSPYYKIAGKTGTAQILVGKHYSNTYRASFVGFFPADKPAYSCIVVVHQPSNGVYYGGWVAGPVFKEIADKIYSTRLELHQKDNNNKNYIVDKLPDMKSGNMQDAELICKNLGIKTNPENETQWMAAQTLATDVQMKERMEEDGVVPNVMGMGLKDALFLLENQGLTVDFKGTGKVKQQSLSPGSKAARGQAITIDLG